MTDMSFDQLCELFAYTPKGRPLQADEVAELLGVHRSAVDHYRVRGVGPRYYSPPGIRRIYYAEGEVLRWLASSSFLSTSEKVAS